jgi:ankyrin repeat protein
MAPIHVAAKNGNLRQVMQLLTANNINAGDLVVQRAPLHFAAEAGHVHVARLLILSGANVNEPTIDGDPPLAYAVMGNHVEMVEFLVSVPGVNLAMRNGTGKTIREAVGAGPGRTEARILELVPF